MASDTQELNPENVRVGATIKALRDAHGLTQAELARAVGISAPLLCLIESGHRRAKIGVCRDIARVLNVKLAAITVADYAQIADVR